ncbi:MAG: quinolinate synthase [Syntrophaceae bacterium CG2_30_49_12]|nr:MAG: quinolinate synthase [Syntrophaceae bacterium CG2_30_49_12]PIP07226.1 MAG: quinolinate synthase [Syntrophobacterales bacterium CG23_combo_of_CG06-09_8_20_14_all_48_27]PJC73139.1 MAG: quinolinate synthase [Syntrophobacterales bacterium CG_4_8_14_3_um_filter_49_14]
MEIIEKIERLKREKNAIILAHNYQIPDVQDVADYVGDSLGLSMKAAKTDADIIVFCGVLFMAETAKILSPQKTVLIPDRNAGCPMANMINAPQLRDLKSKHPRAKVLCYVNTTAEVKAECDLCCTSANAVRMVTDVLRDEREIIFAPDKYLADYVSRKTGRNFITWKGFCPTHVKILVEDILRQKSLHPEAEVVVHPECTPPVIEVADKVASTEGMCKYAGETRAKELIIGTETGILHRLRKENPDKVFYPASELAVCPNMKLTTLEKVLWSLEGMNYEVNVPEEVISRAKQSIQRMLG